MMTIALDPKNLFRLPWTRSDNGMSWLEITTQCNIKCQACYRDPRKDGHKSLAQIEEELHLISKLRKSDGISIAGGEPLIHPDIVDIVRLVRKMGFKPSINSNGMALTGDLAHKLAQAGAASFTFHVDTTQKRKDIDGTLESDLNDLRLKLARIIAETGTMTCGMNITVSGKNLGEIPDLVRWAVGQAGLVHSVHFILYRDPVMGENLDFYAGAKKVELDRHFSDPELSQYDTLFIPQVAQILANGDPLYSPAAYIGGTARPNMLKWLLATRFILDQEVLGYVGPKFYEISQLFSHLFLGKWLAVSRSKDHRAGRLLLFLFFLFDRGIRKMAWRYLVKIFRHPSSIFKPVYLQWFLIQQPVDFQEDGELNMCDCCPNMTIHEGKLHWSCRLEEIKEFGVNLTATPKKDKSHKEDH